MAEAKQLSNASGRLRFSYGFGVGESSDLPAQQPFSQTPVNSAGGGTSSSLAPGEVCVSSKPTCPDNLNTHNQACCTKRRKPTSLHPSVLTACQWRIVQVISSAAGAPLSRAQIAQQAGCCLQTVKRALPVVSRLGLVKVRHHFLANGGQVPNSYVVTAKGRRSLAAYVDAQGGTPAAYAYASSPGP